MGEVKRREAAGRVISSHANDDNTPLTEAEIAELEKEIGDVRARLAPKSEVRQTEALVGPIDGETITMIVEGRSFAVARDVWREWAKSPDLALGYLVPQKGMKVVLTGFNNGALRRFKITAA